jgi:hypothetical protein
MLDSMSTLSAPSRLISLIPVVVTLLVTAALVLVVRTREQGLRIAM